MPHGRVRADMVECSKGSMVVLEHAWLLELEVLDDVWSRLILERHLCVWNTFHVALKGVDMGLRRIHMLKSSC